MTTPVFECYLVWGSGGQMFINQSNSVSKKKRKERNEEETFAVFQNINVVGWAFDGWERDGAFLKLSALEKKTLGLSGLTN